MSKTPRTIKYRGRLYKRAFNVTRQDTASSAYQKTRQEINKALTELKPLLEKHAKEQQGEPRHWGYQGDLSYILGKLHEVISFLKQDEA